jgi:hypothetical protein
VKSVARSKTLHFTAYGVQDTLNGPGFGLDFASPRATIVSSRLDHGGISRLSRRANTLSGWSRSDFSRPAVLVAGYDLGPPKRPSATTFPGRSWQAGERVLYVSLKCKS